MRSNTWNSRTGASSLRNLVSGPRSSLVVYSGNADILEQFNISREAVRQTRCPPVFSLLSILPPIYIHLVFLSPTYAAPHLPVLFVLKKAERLRENSVLLFPFQLDALANLCPRPLRYSIFRFPAFIERDTPSTGLDWKNNRALRRSNRVAKPCVRKNKYNWMVKFL